MKMLLNIIEINQSAIYTTLEINKLHVEWLESSVVGNFDLLGLTIRLLNRR